jgi:hypothetical protein
MTLTVYQLDFQDPMLTVGDELPYKKINQIDEFCLASPYNTTKATCEAFSRKYRDHKMGVMIYGDPSGNQQDTRSEKGHNDYKIIKQELKQFHSKNRVEKVAPSVIMRGEFINTIFRNQPEKDSFAKGYKGLSIHIDEDCTHSIKDFTNLLEDAEGKKLKAKKTDPKTKVRFEQYGHTSDSFEYFICRVLRKEYAEYQRGDISSSNYHVPPVRNTRF